MFSSFQSGGRVGRDNKNHRHKNIDPYLAASAKAARFIATLLKQWCEAYRERQISRSFSRIDTHTLCDIGFGPSDLSRMTFGPSSRTEK